MTMTYICTNNYRNYRLLENYFTPYVTIIVLHMIAYKLRKLVISILTYISGMTSVSMKMMQIKQV